MTEPVTPVRTRNGHRLGWTAALALVLVVAGGLGYAAYHFRAGSHHTGAALTARAHPVARLHPGHRIGAGPTAAAAPARVLTPASAAAFGTGGAGGDNSDLAPLAIDGNPATAWHTDWYATARFGDLYPGTGLLVDMGRPVTIEAVNITLGSATVPASAARRRRTGDGGPPARRPRGQRGRRGPPEPDHASAWPLRAHLVHQPAAGPGRHLPGKRV